MMEYFQNRLNSFKFLKYDYGISPVHFAHAGFYYSKTGDIECFACKHILFHLTDLSEPYFEHLHQITHDCTYLLKTTGDHTAIALVLHTFSAMDTFDQPYSSPAQTDYSYFYDRYFTFRNFDNKRHIPIFTLAHMGFSYIPKSNEVKCHSCDYTTTQFHDLHNLVTVHLSKQCKYTKIVFGEDIRVIDSMTCLGLN